MFGKTVVVLTVVLVTASGALAATKSQAVSPAHDVYDLRGFYAGSDPDHNVRFELRRDDARGRN